MAPVPTISDSSSGEFESVGSSGQLCVKHTVIRFRVSRVEQRICAVTISALTDRSASGPPISVRTHPGVNAVTRIPSPFHSNDSLRVNMFRAAWDWEMIVLLFLLISGSCNFKPCSSRTSLADSNPHPAPAWEIRPPKKYSPPELSPLARPRAWEEAGISENISDED